MKQPWYIAGLHFECVQCGNCCSGPEEGYIWISEREIEMAADELGMSKEQFAQQYTKVECGDVTLVEEKTTKDCIFLSNKCCGIYKVRPNQCRTWPFWDMNLESPEDWGWASSRCPGINRGRLYTYQEIEEIRTCRKWWND
ncbi:MAG: YkgJ family cysteine cluster protein [Sedimentisphaeraceae bacterium JB056]